MKIAAAGNTEVPAYLVLLAKGYEVSHVGGEGPDDAWLARDNQNSFYANSPIQLLGVVAMAEARGANWPATDQEIDDFLKKYDLA